ncbi:MAG TPA: alpha/beta hydrolase [Acidimicrobiales bacterium]|nr:alpha/beta hydrolase [Acidimicrobiales bacterium]
MGAAATSGYAPVNGMELYWERRGTGGTPLVVVHGGYGLVSALGDVLDALARGREVVAPELQGHGHTGDIDRPFSYEAFGDDVAALIEHLGMPRADVLGYSLGGGAALRCAVQHPGLVRRLVVVSTPFRHSAWFPEVLAAFDHMGRGLFEQLRQAPLYRDWVEVAPDPDAFPALMDKTGELLRRPYDWSDAVGSITARTLLAFGDADSIPPSHAAEFYGLLGGGQRDAGVDGASRPEARLAIVPGRTHYDVLWSPWLVEAVAEFLDAP